MPIEDIAVPKAPKGWRPTSDQMQQMQNDPRLKRMSMDDLYFYFNQKGPGSTGNGRGGSPTPAPRPAPQPQPATGGIFGWVDQVRRALGGT